MLVSDMFYAMLISSINQLLCVYIAAHELHPRGAASRVHRPNGHVHLQDEQG